MYQYHFSDAVQEGERPFPHRPRQPRGLPQRASAITLFADIVGYTEHCESLDPEEAFLLLSEFYRRTSRATALHNAAIVDYFGDEVLAVWKGTIPLAVQAFRALRCGFAILVELERWNDQRLKAGLRAVKAGIGIHTGPVLFGYPPAGEREAPSVFGDTVNIASRLERQTRFLGTDIIISEELFQLAAKVAGDTALLDNFPATVSINLSGRAKPLKVRSAVRYECMKREIHRFDPMDGATTNSIFR
jgi:adenylate cyclase